jgi:hypothetical protein
VRVQTYRTVLKYSLKVIVRLSRVDERYKYDLEKGSRFMSVQLGEPSDQSASKIVDFQKNLQNCNLCGVSDGAIYVSKRPRSRTDLKTSKRPIRKS